jgi:putative inorganic carbon (HCO3(-)) transporter
LATWEDPTVNPELKMNRIFGTLKPSNPNLLAGFLIPSLATAGGLALIALVKRRWMATLGLLGVTVMVLAALVLTGSRGGYLSLGAMGLGFFALCGHLIWYDPILKLTRRLKTIWILMLVGAVALGGLALAVSPSLQHRVGSIFAMREDSSNAYRMNVYASAVQMFQDNPVVGIGPGNGTFKLVYGLYMVPGYNALGAYSVPLEIAVEQGLVGLLIFLTLLATLKIRALLLVDSQQPLPQKLLGVLLFCGVVGSIVYGIFDTIWYRPAVNLTFWLFVAALAQQTELLFDRRETKMPQEVPHANS